MTKLNLTSKDDLFVCYDLANIKSIRHGKAKIFHDKKDCEGNGIRVSDSVLVINFNDGKCSTFGDNWTVSFAQ